MIQRFKREVKKDGFQRECYREAVEYLLYSYYYTAQKVNTHLDDLKKAAERDG